MATTLADPPERPPSAPVHPRPARRGPWPLEFYRSAVGKKWVMALTGLALIGFVFVHALGNLKVYFGAEDFNHYGEWLREILVPSSRAPCSSGSCASASPWRSPSTSTPRTR